MPNLSSSRSLKRTQSVIDFIDDPTYLAARPFKRSKSENVSQSRRFLIGCAHLIFVKNDARERNDDGDLIPVDVPLKKAYAPSSDLPQKDMVAIYFDDIDRTVVSQSKSKSHLFAPPDWTRMEIYLFPWIRFNSNNPHLTLTRCHIKHVGFRIWEVLVTRNEIILKYEEVAGQPLNMPLGDVRGWWWESDGEYPRGYNEWLQRRDHRVPGTCNLRGNANNA